MSRLALASKENKIDTVVNELRAIVANGGSRYTSLESAANVIGMESLKEADFAVIQSSYADMMHDLRGSGLALELMKGVEPEQLEVALEACALTLMSGANPEAYYAAAIQNAVAPAGGVLVNTQQSGMAFNDTFGMESFDPVSVQKYLAYTAVANALSVINGDFESVFFPPQIVPAGQTGIDVDIRIPRVFAMNTRTNNGVPISFVKHSIIDALVDSSILDIDATTVVPYASSATLPVTLVPNSVIATTTRVIDGVNVDTRPILFGQEVDVIALSSAPGLLKNGAFDTTDSLDPVMNVGTVYYKLSVVTGIGSTPVTTEVILAADVSAQTGTQLTQVAAGVIQQYHANPHVELVIKQDFVPVMGTASSVVGQIEGILGVASGTHWTITGSMRLAANANIETAVMVVDATGAKLTRSFDSNGIETPVAALNTSTHTVTIVPVGYVPNVRRTNSNLRTNGTIIDNNTVITYRFPIKLSSPIVSQSPVGTLSSTTLEGLTQAMRIRNNGNCVKALKQLEVVLAANNGIPPQSSMMGAEMVKPYYVRDSMDLQTVVNNMQSQYALADMRGALLAAVSNMANELLIKSNYLAALEFCTNSNEGFEIIIVTDTQIGSNLMESGDNRSFGDRRKYRIATSLNSFFKGKIYISFRRSDRGTGMHPLDFGGQLITPALTYDVQVSRNSATVKEIHTIPRTVPYATLPVLGRIDVNNLDLLFVQ